MARSTAISLKQSQYSFSRLTLVLWSAIVIERFVERFETGKFRRLRKRAIGTMLFGSWENGLAPVTAAPDQQPPALAQ